MKIVKCEVWNDIMNCIPGDEKVYVVKCDNSIHFNDYPIEFLNSLNVSSMSPHKLKLKVIVLSYSFET